MSAHPTADVELDTYERAQAEIYDAIYAGRGKDYAAETSRLVELVRSRCPAADSLLDVACGSGGHLRHARTQLGHVEGVELSRPMIDEASARVPGVPVHQGDMREFDLGRGFDAAVCLFSSVGYLATTDDLRAAVACMAGHLTPGGVLVIEPWFTPRTFTDRYIARDLLEEPGRVIARVSHSRREGRRVPIRVHYVVAETDGGVRHFQDVHRMTLFTDEEYASAFTAAGLEPEAIPPEERFPCGLWLGRRPIS